MLKPTDSREVSWFHFGILLVLGFLVYSNSLRSPFMLDDYGFLSQFQGSSVVSHLLPEPHKQLGIESAKTQRTYYRPLAHIVPHIQYLVFKYEPVGYHITNVLLLVGAAWCVVLTLSLVIPAGLALAVGVLFMVHPINGLMVNYITASVFAVQVISICLSLYFLQRGKPWKSVLFFLLALLCHETSFMVPFYAVLFCLIGSSGLKAALIRTKWLWTLLGGYMLFRTVYVPLSNSLFYSLSTTGLSWDQSIASILRLLVWYGQKLLVPVDIFLMWSVPFVRGNGWDWVAGGLCFVIPVAILLRRLWGKGQRASVLFFLWFLVGLLPIFLGAFATANMGALLEAHWFIPATIGLFAALVLSAAHFIPARWHKPVFAAVTASLIICAWNNNRLWSNEIRYYERWLTQNSDFKAVHYFLGTAYDRQGQLDKAREHLQQSILGRYKDWMVHLALGKISLKQGRLYQAREDLLKAYALEPKNSDILNALGALEFQARNLDKARQWFEQAVETNRFNMEPRMNLAVVYKRMGDVPKAIAQYEEILRLQPGNVPAVQALQRLRP